MVTFFKRVRNVVKSVALAGGMMALAACDPSMIPGPITPGGGGSTDGPVKVALLVPGGSGSAELDRIARSLENSARLAISDMEGVEVDLTVYNTQRNTGVAVSAATQAVAAGADVILGPLDGEAAAAVGVAVAGTGTNVLAFSNNTAIAGGNVFLLGQTFSDSASRLARYARSQGKSRVVVIHARDVAGEAGRVAVARALAQAGLTLAGTTSYNLSLQDVTAAAPAVRSAASSSGADALFLTSNTAGALPIFAELLPEAGLSPDKIQYLGLSRWDLDPRLFSLKGVQGGWFAMPDRSRSAAFQGRYSGAVGASPHPLAFTAYDGMAAIGALWAQGGANPLATSAITRGQGFQGSNGILRFRADGTNQRGLAIGSIQNGQLVTIDAAPNSFGGAGF